MYNEIKIRNLGIYYLMCLPSECYIANVEVSFPFRLLLRIIDLSVWCEVSYWTMIIWNLMPEALISNSGFGSVLWELQGQTAKKKPICCRLWNLAIVIFTTLKIQQLSGQQDIFSGFLARISEGLSPEVSPSASGFNSRTNSEQDLVKVTWLIDRF